MADSTGRGKVKVVDRRWFTAEGEEREPAPGEQPPGQSPPPPRSPAAEAAPPPSSAPAAESRSARTGADEPAPRTAAQEPSALGGPGISDIVDLLAQQAMAFLSGQVPGRGRDPATARYFIDLLGVLKEKTTGRLTLEESAFLDDVLYQLRSLYVAATR